MRSRIHKCRDCGTYTLKDKCPQCGSTAVSAKPARFSPLDPYGRYRRRMKKEIEKDSHQEGRT